MNSPIILFVIVGLIIVGFFIASSIAERKRREAILALANRLGLFFAPDKDYGLAQSFSFLNTLREGANRYAFNVLTGEYGSHAVTCFDYHYETTSHNGKSTQTNHHHFSFYTLKLPSTFPELRIGQESFLSKIAQAVGYDDIDFESHEFSRTFCVRSRDKKFAYDVCNAGMIEYLLANRDLTIEIEQDRLAIAFNGKMRLEQIEPNMDRLLEIRNRMPEYLFSE